LESWRRERERLAALSRQLVHVQEEERSRVARELHDEIGQLLTSLRLALRAGPAAHDLAEGILDDLFARARGISMTLRPPMLEDLGLGPTLIWHCERFTAQTGVRVDLRESGLERRFPPEAELAVFRIIQEALTNVARHAEAYEARIIVEGGSDWLRAQIIDQGIGFDAQRTPPARSSGLTGMHERARSLEGRLAILSAPEGGTRVSVWIPVAPGPSRRSEDLP
jgi:signal transduction histidine kinase